MSDETEKLPEADDAEILLDETIVAGFVVRPWTIQKCASMTPIIEQIAAEIKNRKLTFRDFFVKTDGKIEVINLDQLFFVVMPFSPEIISITLNLTADELKKIPQDDLFNIMSVIISQNVGYVKNLFALIEQAMRTLEET